MQPDVTPVIAPNVVVLDDVTAAIATVTSDTVSIPLPAAARYPALGTGAVIASGYGTGFLRRVTGSSVETVGLLPQLRMTTTQATIADAVVDGSFRWSRQIADIHQEFGGTRIAGDDTVNVSLPRGHINFTATLSVTGLIRNHSLQRFDLTITGPLEAEFLLGVSAQGQASVERQIDLFRFTSPPIPFAIGPLPVVVVASINIGANASAEASASAAIEMGFTANHALSVGMAYEGGEPRVTGEREFGLHPIGPRVQCGGRASARAGLNERVQLSFYDVVGPYVMIEPNTRFQASATNGAGPAWSAHLGIRGSVGVVLDIFGLWHRELPLYQTGDRDFAVSNSP